MPDQTAATVAKKLKTLKPTALLTGTFVQVNADGTIEVDFGQGPVSCQSASTFQPLAGDSVRCIRYGGTTLLLGPSKPRSAIGTITATGSITATVTTSIGSKVMPFLSTYSPTVGDVVLLDWASGGVIIGKLATPSPSVPATPPAGSYTPPPAPAPTAHSLDFTATDSGTWSVPGGDYFTADVWCTSTGNDRGAWFYGTAIADTIPDGATITSVQIYVDEFYNGYPAQLALIGLHNLSSKSGAPTISSAVSIPKGSGFMSLPTSFGDALKTGSMKGVGTGSTSASGYHKYHSKASDANSGLLRIGWTY